MSMCGPAGMRRIRTSSAAGPSVRNAHATSARMIEYRSRRIGESLLRSPQRGQNTREVPPMGLVVLLLILALLFGGVGLFVEGLKWLLIVALVLFVASFFTGY